MSNVPKQPPRRFAVVDSDGDVYAGYDSAESAWAAINGDRSVLYLHKMYGPYEVVELVPVPKPVPPRPSVAFNAERVTHNGNVYVLNNSGDRYGSVGIIAYNYVLTDDLLRALLDLPEATRQWMAEHVGDA